MATTIALVLLAALAAPVAAQQPPKLLADCSACDEGLTAPVYYGCIGDTAYVEYDGVPVECGAALSLNATAAIPKFYYPEAKEDALYTLLMVDTTEIDPIVGTVAPFYPHPIIHYGAINIPGDVLVDGMSMDKFHFDTEQGIRVRPFWPYEKPVPNEELMKKPPSGVEPPPLETRAFNYEFILGEQAYKRDDPLMSRGNYNFDFVQFVKKSIVGNPVASTYIATGYCVNEVEEGLDLLDVDCVVPAETVSGLGTVPDRVGKEGGGYTGPGTASGGQEWFGNEPPAGGASNGGAAGAEGGEGAESSAAANRWSSVVAMALLLVGIVAV